MPDVRGGQQRALDSLALEPHVVMSSLPWVKGTVLQASPRAANTPNWMSLQFHHSLLLG